jgi:hypothetical protein
MNNKSEKKNIKNIFLSDKLKEKNNKIDKLKQDLALSELILNDLKYKNKKLNTMDNTNNIHPVNKTYEKNNSFSLKPSSENFSKNKKMLTLNLNDNFFLTKKTKKEIRLPISHLY